MNLWVSLFVFKGSGWSWQSFQFRRPEPIGLALNKGIIESETQGSPVLVDLVHIPSDLFWHLPKTNGNPNYVRCCERMAEV